MVEADAAGYAAGDLAAWVSPTLFAQPRLVVVSGVEAAADAFVADALTYLGDVQDDVTLVLRHAGGQRGKKLLDAVRAAPGAVWVDCPPVKKDAERNDFVVAELRRLGRRASPGALRALLDGVGTDLRGLAAACSQLAADLPDGPVDAADVERYYGGRADVTGFKVADAVVLGQCDQALVLLRQAVAAGVDPVPVVAAVASRLRTLARVAAAGRGRAADVARDLALAPWQVDKARRELGGWTPQGIATGIIALAEADTAVKGGGRDPVYAVERAVVTITAARDG